MDNIGNFNSMTSSASVPPKLNAFNKTLTNNDPIDTKTFCDFLDSYAKPTQGTYSFFCSNRDPKDLITMANKFTLPDAAAAEDPGTIPDAQQLRIATAITAGSFGDPIPEVVATKLKGILTFVTVLSAKTTIETAIKPVESGRVTEQSLDTPPTPPITMSSPASTGQPPLLNLPDVALLKHFDSLDIRSLVQFSTSNKEALSLVKRYLALPDTKVDLSDPSIRDKITDDSLKLFSECKHINLSYCRNITNAGLAHLTQATSINLKEVDCTGFDFSDFTGLTTLNLCDATITAEQFNGIPQASKASIKALDLEGVNCTDFDFSAFTGLTTLNLGDATITAAQFNAIPQASKASIKKLHLWFVNCNGFDLTGFQPGVISR